MLHGCEYGEATRDKLEWFIDEWNRWRTNDFKHFQDCVFEKIDKIKDKFSKRPSWSIMWIITTLTSLLIGILGFGIARLIFG